MKIKRRSRWLILIVVLYCASAAVSSVSAHAVLLQSNPLANAVLEQAPVQVELFFSEPLEANLSSITVFDSNNLIVDARDARVDPSDPKRMTVTLHSLPDGVYTVTWSALSSIDGHQTVGTFPFAVGDANATAVEAIQQTATAELPFTALLSKFLLLVALAILVGKQLFTALVWEPVVLTNHVTEPGIWNTLHQLALIAVLMAIGIGMLSQAGQSAGTELSYPWDPQMGRILTETRLGLIWLLRLALAMLATWLYWNNSSALKKWIGFAVHLTLLFTVTLTSHAATDARPLLPVLGDWLHLIGMTFWFGGLACLFTAIRRLQQMDHPLRTQLISLLTSRFSASALIFVSLIGLTGFYSAYLRVGSWTAALTSLYGHVLLIKQVFVIGLLSIAAVNLLVISPRLQRTSSDGTSGANITRRFVISLTIEIICAVLLLGSVSFLTYIPPARVVSSVTELTDRSQVDDLTMDISIAPGRVGQNTFTLTLHTSDGHPVHVAKEVLLRFTPEQGTIPPSELQLIGGGDGTFSAKGSYLSLPGRWQVQAVVRREGKFDAFANFDFELRSAGSNAQAASIARQSGFLLLLIGLLCALLAASAPVQSSLRWGLGAPATLLMAGMGFFYLTSPIAAEVVQINPIPPNEESISAGQTLFTTYCVPCHGVTGLGDGPIGLTLNPRPADLRQHAIPGVHTDAQLFEWITNGFPGSQMPPFKTTLSDTDRWNLVNYIRTLAPR